MAYGLEVYNSNGFIQFNSTSYACRVISSGSSAVQTRTLNGFTYKKFPISGNVLGPQRRLWLRAANTNEYLSGGDGADYDAATDITWIRVGDTVPVGNLYYYVLTDYGGTDSTSGYGLVVKNPNGGVEFNSSDTQMMVTTTWSTDIYDSSSWPYTEYYGYIRVDYNLVDIPISVSPYTGATPYLFVDGLGSGWIKNYTANRGDTWSVNVWVMLLNSTTIRLKIQRTGYTMGTYAPKPDYHRTNIIIGVMK